MSMDFRKTTYRPNRPNTRLRTSYGGMSKWMSLYEDGSNAVNRPLLPTSLFIQEHEQRHPPFLFPKLRESPRVDGASQEEEYERQDVPLSLPPLPTKDPVHLQFDQQAGYDDFHKAYRHCERQTQLTFPVFGPPRLRYGRAGGSWRHIKEVMQARGGRTLFVDGQIRNEDNDRLEEVPGGNLLQPSARPVLSRGRTCHVMDGSNTTRAYNMAQRPRQIGYGHPIATEYRGNSSMASR